MLQPPQTSGKVTTKPLRFARIGGVRPEDCRPIIYVNALCNPEMLQSGNVRVPPALLSESGIPSTIFASFGKTLNTRRYGGLSSAWNAWSGRSSGQESIHSAAECLFMAVMVRYGKRRKITSVTPSSHCIGRR